jgi:NADH:ubiquinone oxidoreductase subunit E
MIEVSQDVEEKLKSILNNHIKEEGNIISLLQDIQDTFGYIPEKIVDWFSQKLDIPESKIFGVATFYSQFHLQPRGKNIISICCGTACYVKGGIKIAERVLMELGLSYEGDTTTDKMFTVDVVRCMGACSIAPVVIINNRVYPNMTVNSTSRLIKKFKKEG